MSPVSFTARTDSLLSQAEAICARRGTRLTALRRHVLGLVLDSPKPAGAYDMLDQLRPQHFASLTAMLDVESVLENMSHSGARQLSQVAAFSHAVQPVCVAFTGPAIIAHLSCFPHNPVTSWAASKSHYGFLQYSCTLSDD